MLVVIDKLIFAKRGFVHSVTECANRSVAVALYLNRCLVLVLKSACKMNGCKSVLLVLFLRNLIISKSVRAVYISVFLLEEVKYLFTCKLLALCRDDNIDRGIGVGNKPPSYASGQPAAVSAPVPLLAT